MSFNRRHFLLIFLIIALLVVFMPFKVYYRFESTATILPVKEWHLMRGQDDSFMSELRDNATNVVSHLKTYKFERGDIAEVQIDEKLDTGKFVNSVDTIAFIHSFYIENELTRLRNLKSIEEDALKMSQSGEKQELIDQAENRFEFAEHQLELEKKKYEREKNLHTDSIISTAEFEITENSFQLAKINVEIARDELRSLQAGAKPEELEYIRQRIASYDREINKLEKQAQHYYITPPIGGILSVNRVLNGIISISDTSRFILRIPVQVNNLKYVKNISAIRFSIPGYEQKIDASFLDIEENVNILPNEQMVLARAVISGGSFRLYPGMMVKCRVMCDKVTLYQYMKRSLKLNL